MNNNVCTKCKYFKTCGGANSGAPCEGYERITRAEIFSDIQATRDTIKTLENSKTVYHEKWRELFDEYKKAARDNGPEAARIGKSMEMIKKDEDAAGALIADLNTKILILKNNYRIALFDETMPAVVAVLNKYNGKPYGEKTRAKIRDEIKDAAGVYFYINCRSWCDELVISDEYLRYNSQLEIHTSNDEHILINNRINAAALENLSMNYDVFIDDPAARVQALKAAYNAARDAQRTLEKKCSEYNNLTVYGVESIYAEKHLY